MAKITKIRQAVPVMKEKKKVAAYARVSMETERLHHSLSAQISYYSSLIQKNPDWEYAGVYADDGISGTGIVKRTEFQRMILDAENGGIDIILTKSIQRFARNTVDLLETVRHLKDIGVEVRFEKERISSMSGDGELMLTILASFAQEESRSISENVKWSVKKRMEKGIPTAKIPILGYRWAGDTLKVVPEEAAVVKRIYRNFLDGKSRLETERELDAEGIRSVRGNVMHDSQIHHILTNITYTGNTLLQKEYVEDPITKKRKKNKGELPQYFIENTHEAIIDMETWRYVQDEIARRRELGPLANKSLNITSFTGKIKCPHCGKSYTRHKRKNRANQSELGDDLVYWICGSKGKKNSQCPVRGSIPERYLKRECAAVLGLEKFSEKVFSEKVDRIDVPEQGLLKFRMKDGRIIERRWENTSHKDCWTKEMRRQVSERRRNRRTRIVKGGGFTGFVKCAACGMNYRRQTKAYRDGTDGSYLRCPHSSSCGNKSIRVETMKQLTAEVLGIPEFDETIMDEKLDHAMIDHGTVIFCFKDGRTEERTYREKRKTYRHTEAEKAELRTARESEKRGDTDCQDR